MTVSCIWQLWSKSESWNSTLRLVIIKLDVTIVLAQAIFTIWVVEKIIVIVIEILVPLIVDSIIAFIQDVVSHFGNAWNLWVCWSSIISCRNLIELVFVYTSLKVTTMSYSVPLMRSNMWPVYWTGWDLEVVLISRCLQSVERCNTFVKILLILNILFPRHVWLQIPRTLALFILASLAQQLFMLCLFFLLRNCYWKIKAFTLRRIFAILIRCVCFATVTHKSQRYVIVFIVIFDFVIDLAWLQDLFAFWVWIIKFKGRFLLG